MVTPILHSSFKRVCSHFLQMRDKAYSGNIWTVRTASLSSLSIYSSLPKFSSEQRNARVRCFSRRNLHKLFIPPCVPDFISIGIICLSSPSKTSSGAGCKACSAVSPVLPPSRWVRLYWQVPVECQPLSVRWDAGTSRRPVEVPTTIIRNPETVPF